MTQDTHAVIDAYEAGKVAGKVEALAGLEHELLGLRIQAGARGLRIPVIPSVQLFTSSCRILGAPMNYIEIPPEGLIWFTEMLRRHAR